MKSQNKIIGGLKIVNKSFLSIETFFMALITIALVGVISIEVLCRYFLFIPIAWAEELTRYLFIWLTYIGSAYALYDGSQIEIDVFQQLIEKSRMKGKQKALKALRTLSLVSTFLFLSFFGKIFFDYMLGIWHTAQTTPTMGIPMGYVYLPVFIGTVMGAYHEIYLLLNDFVQKDSAQKE